MTILGKLKERLNTIIAAGALAACSAVMGLILMFVMAPQQTAEWKHIQSLPEIDADAYADAAQGEEIAVTGTLVDNKAITAEGYVAYSIDQWQVDTSDDDDDPEGRWIDLENNVPALYVSIPGGTIQTAASNSVNLSGSVEERIEMGTGYESASYNGQDLPDGSTRTMGISNGDTVTIIGAKNASGDIVPGRFFAGTRAQLVENIRTGAQMAFVAGLIMLLCAPLIMVISIISALFGKRGRSGIKVIS